MQQSNFRISTKIPRHAFIITRYSYRADLKNPAPNLAFELYTFLRPASYKPKTAAFQQHHGMKNALSQLGMTWDSLDWLGMQHEEIKRVTPVLM